MTNPVLIAVAIFSVLVLASCTSVDPETPGRPAVDLEVGGPVPDLVLPTLKDGTPSSLAQFRGRKVVLHVFASW